MSPLNVDQHNDIMFSLVSDKLTPPTNKLSSEKVAIYLRMLRT